MPCVWIVSWGEGEEGDGKGRGGYLSSEIGHFWNLILEHFLDGFLLEDLGACLGVFTVVEECGDDLAVVSWTGEAAGAAGVECCFNLFFGLCV